MSFSIFFLRRDEKNKLNSMWIEFLVSIIRKTFTNDGCFSKIIITLQRGKWALWSASALKQPLTLKSIEFDDLNCPVCILPRFANIGLLWYTFALHVITEKFFHFFCPKPVWWQYLLFHNHWMHIGNYEYLLRNVPKLAFKLCWCNTK